MVLRQPSGIYIDCANPRRSISSKPAYVLIRKLVAGFRAAGLRKGDCVCIDAFNNVGVDTPRYCNITDLRQLHYPIIVSGIIAAGRTFLDTNPAYTSYELHHALKVSKTKFIITERDLLAAIKLPASELNIPASRIFLFGRYHGIGVPEHYTWRTLLEHGEEDWVRFNDLHTARNTIAFLMLPSGTTGLPNAAQLSH
ncbi:hypothetical protein LTR49_027582 [Elasticomyces elasticus]|nr:hypothetical protein LTR49_027582 [Elasticomyces elasticus]